MPNLKGLTIGVLCYRHHRSARYWAMCGITQIWREWGASILVCSDKNFRWKGADIWWNHFDSTYIPPRLRERIGALNEPVINGQLLDISKRRISRNLVDASSDWDGPVIVKSNFNSAGKADRSLLREARSRLGWLPASFSRRRLGLGDFSLKEAVDSYQVYSGYSEVPNEVRDDPSFVVERFYEDRRGEHYSIRMMEKLGNATDSSRMFSDSPFVKSTTALGWEMIDTDPRVVEMATAMGVDYGKIDYLVQGDDVIIVDVNRTPAITSQGQERRRFLSSLAVGIQDFL